MISNYTGRYSSLTWQQKLFSRPLAGARRNTHVRKKTTGENLLLKAVGAMLLTVLTLGLGTSCWYGMQVQIAIDEIGKTRLTNRELALQQKELSAQHQLLLQRDTMEKTAMKIGLFTPTKEIKS